jgi:hypothetical protein
LRLVSWSALDRILCLATWGCSRKAEKTGAIFEMRRTTEHDLYSELLAIGRKEKSIRPEFLMNYDSLLNCAEVRRRAGQSAGRAVLAGCASEALQAAIASIVSPANRRIAEAALCATPDFVGLQIKGRIRKLDGINENVFKYQRQIALHRIIGFLTREVPAPSVNLAVPQNHFHSKSSAPDLDKRQLQKLAKYAAQLHFAGLGTLFAYDFDDELMAHNVVITTEARDNLLPRTTLSDYLFKTYIEFVYCAAWPLEMTSDSISEGVAAVLHTLWSEVAEASPVGPSKVTPEQRKGLEFWTMAEEAQKFLPLETYERWLEWCKGRGVIETPSDVATTGKRVNFLRKTRADLVAAVKPLAANSGAFSFIVARHVGLEEPVHSEARLMAHKALATRYKFDEWAPIIGDKPLRYRLDAYFDSESIALTDSALACHTSEL